MKTVQLESSALASCAYSSKDKELTINFNDGEIRVYRKVPKAVYEDLVNAKSPGGYFNGSIRGKFDYE